MAKQGNPSSFPQQLSLDFQRANRHDPVTPKGPKVASFVDAATLAVRRQAVARVKSAGIFSLQKSQSK